MNTLLRFLPAAVLTVAAFAQEAPKAMTEEQKKQLITELSSVMDSTLDRKKEKLKAGIAALTPASQDPNAAMALFEKSLKKADYDSKPNMGDRAWREWKTANREQLSSAANKKALQYQLRWALLCMEAAQDDPETFDPQKYRQRGSDLVTEVVKDKQVMTESSSPFNGSVLDGPIGRAYQLEGYQPDGWPGSVMDLHRVIDSLVLKPARDKGDIKSLRNGWNFVISGTKKTIADMQETAKKEARKAASAMPGAAGGEGRRMARMIEMISKEDLNTLNDTMEWAREVDCFMCGDELNASLNMFRILRNMKDPKRQEMLIGAMMMLMQRKDEITNMEDNPWAKARKARSAGQAVSPQGGRPAPANQVAPSPAQQPVAPRPVVEEA